MDETTKSGGNGKKPVEMPLTRKNFIAMGISAFVIIVGFLLMLGKGSGVDGDFNPDIFSTRRVVVGPTIAFIGFIAMGASIIYKPRKRD